MANENVVREPSTMADWYQLDVDDVLARLGTNAEHGLSEEEAARRLQEYGPNELVEYGGRSPLLILWDQITSVFVIVLIIAAVVSVALGDYRDAGAILAIVVLNAILGFTQEYRAERAIAALRQLAVPTVRVRRDGRVRLISARELVPGDIVLLEAGSAVPADGRVVESVNLRVQEAALTGESEPVEKDPAPLPIPELPLGDRRNLVYLGTVVTYGRGVAVVTATGMRSELGRIASLIQTVEREPTPLQRRLEQLARGLAAAATVIVAVVFVMGLLRGENLELMLLTAISLAVAAVPEGLPAVVTIALALGAQRMLQRRALIRQLPAVETLGSVTVICSDKTGTLTENRMTVTVLDVAGDRIDLTEWYHRGALVFVGDDCKRSLLGERPTLALLVVGGALANDALLEHRGDHPDHYHVVGDPTEGALVVVAARFGFRKDELERVLPRVAELPFDSERRRMTTVHHLPPPTTRLPEALEAVRSAALCVEQAPCIAFTKGAVDSLLSVARGVFVGGRVEPLDEAWRARITASHDELAANGMRVLGVAFRPIQSLPARPTVDDLERDLIFVGMTGMLDPPRPEVKEAVRTAIQAGIRPIMITGDHPLTARHIARQLGIATNGSILTGQELARMPLDQLEEEVEKVSVYARVSPEHKLNIVEALQNRGEIVAMTGDGVNDAPALRRADIGIAMGITGTDVAKEAAEMVLLDDNFATIIAAVEEGRVIYDNIRKFIRYILTSNSGEIWVMLAAPFLGMPLPLLPLQILWINLVTDGLPGLALSLEPAERGTMRRPPYAPGESVFSRGLGQHIIWVGLLMGLVSLALGYTFWRGGAVPWQTMVFTTLTLSQMGHALAIRSERESLFRIGLLSNRPLLGAVALTFMLQLAVVYLPFMQGIFSTTSLTANELAISLLLSTVVFWAVEFEKWLLRRQQATMERVTGSSNQ